jgi:hypothetical protein
MSARLLVVPVLATALSAGVVVDAVAAADARTTVTIKAEGTDLSGLVKSPKPRLCAKDRKVVVFRQKGARGGGDDIRFASDTASLEGGVYAWSTGNTGTEGRFYARVRHITGCRADTSDTVVARRNP